MAIRVMRVLAEDAEADIARDVYDPCTRRLFAGSVIASQAGKELVHSFG